MLQAFKPGYQLGKGTHLQFKRIKNPRRKMIKIRKVGLDKKIWEIIQKIGFGRFYGKYFFFIIHSQFYQHFKKSRNPSFTKELHAF